MAEFLRCTLTALQPDLWIHGHGHHQCDDQIGPTRVVANPKGYWPSETMPALENPLFDPKMVLAVR